MRFVPCTANERWMSAASERPHSTESQTEPSSHVISATRKLICSKSHYLYGNRISCWSTIPNCYNGLYDGHKRGSWQMNMAHNWWKSALNYWKCATMLTGNDWWTKQYALWVGWGWEWDLFVRFVGIMSHTHSGGYLELTLQMAIQNAGNDRFIDFVESNQSKQSPVVFYSDWLESHQ